MTTDSELNGSKHSCFVQAERRRWGGQYALMDMWDMCLTVDTQTYNSPHVQTLFLGAILTKDPPVPHLRLPQILFWSIHFLREKMLDMSHYTNLVQLSLNPCSSVNHHTLISHGCALALQGIGHTFLLEQIFTAINWYQLLCTYFSW
jgi:hypothetical protein